MWCRRTLSVYSHSALMCLETDERSNHAASNADAASFSGMKNTTLQVRNDAQVSRWTETVKICNRPRFGRQCHSAFLRSLNILWDCQWQYLFLHRRVLPMSCTVLSVRTATWHLRYSTIVCCLILSNMCALWIIMPFQDERSISRWVPEWLGRSDDGQEHSCELCMWQPTYVPDFVSVSVMTLGRRCVCITLY